MKIEMNNVTGIFVSVCGSYTQVDINMSLEEFTETCIVMNWVLYTEGEGDSKTIECKFADTDEFVAWYVAGGGVFYSK